LHGIILLFMLILIYTIYIKNINKLILIFYIKILFEICKINMYIIIKKIRLIYNLIKIIIKIKYVKNKKVIIKIVMRAKMEVSF